MKNSRWFAFARNTSWIAALLLLLVAAGFAQRRGGFGGGGFGGGFGGLRFEGHDEAPRPVFPSAGEFHFIRLQFFDAYQSRGFGFASRNGMGSGWWIIDWPDAEDHFSLGVQRLTRIEVGESKNLPILDDHLFDYPWIYATNVGNLTLNGDEASRLREYLLRGGFLVVDDFWGPEEWEVFREAMNHVFPNQATPDIPESDSVMHVLYDIREKDRSFIPGTRHLRRGANGSVVVQQPAGTSPAWRAMYDGRNRIIVAINYNTDVGDAWEYADSPQYPEHMTELAYHYGINYLVYALTH